jgi:hypothetical protein
MQGKTPHEIALAAAAAGADPDARRYADAHRILHVAEITPGIPFPHIDHDRAVFFYVGTDPDEGAREIRTAEQVLAYTFGVSFKPRQTVAHDVRHDILTAVLPSGIHVDIVARAQYIGVKDVSGNAPQLASVA